MRFVIEILCLSWEGVLFLKRESNRSLRQYDIFLAHGWHQHNIQTDYASYVELWCV